MADKETFAVLEVGLGPLPPGTGLDDPLIDRLFDAISDLVHAAEKPAGADPYLSGLLRRAQDLGYTDASSERSLEEILTNIGHYVSTYCLHGLHGECRRFCKTCRAPCRCSHHAAESQVMCSAAGHEDMPAAGSCLIDADDDRSYPYCQECLDVLDPQTGRDERIEMAAQVLLDHAPELQRTRLQLDSHAARYIAELIVDALFAR